ncbi:hypothetical protein M413DRAFT_221533 [Hebeloma cylindrosporum]|uniref:Uncharacterized protein n=1 Tax=Hebeloma cylindrosporum TaxID=76867 RepID=A0A0C3CHD3_HEBCY|nr:hypothetical protein M413DRAFT_221533 [Hebeloma cylindrosporum h7]
MVSLKGSNEQYFRRLVYIAHSRQTGNVIAGKSLKLEMMHKHAPSFDDPVGMVPSHYSEFSCFKKVEACVDLLIPDYRADIRFTATNIQQLPDSHWPDAVSKLVHQAKSGAEKRLDIPVMFNHDDLSYVLHSNSDIRQRHYELPDPAKSSRGTFIAETTVNCDSGQSFVTGKGWVGGLSSSNVIAWRDQTRKKAFDLHETRFLVES